MTFSFCRVYNSDANMSILIKKGSSDFFYMDIDMGTVSKPKYNIVLST